MRSKAPATRKEIEDAISRKVEANPGWRREHYAKVRGDCLAQGYKDETCSCGATFLASDHFVRCEDKDCPMRSGQNFLDMMLGEGGDS